MSDWPLVAIGELAVRVGSGVTPTGGSDVYTDSGVVFLRSQNVANSGLLLDDVAFIDSETHRRMAASEVFPFDVLLNITGASIGRCCYLPEGLGQTNVNQHVCAIRLPKPNRCDAKFLASMLASPIGQRQIVRLNAGGNREGLNYQQLRAFRVPWPSRHHREAIAEILSTLDEAIERTEGLIGKLQQMKAGLMHDLFTRGVTPAGHLRPPRDQAPHLYKPSPLGWIPNEWETSSIDSLLERIIDYRGKTPVKTIEGVPLITAKNVRMGYIAPEPKEFIDERDYFTWMTRGIPSHSDVLFTTEAPLGNVAQIGTMERVAFAQRVIILQPSERLHPAFLRLLLMADPFQRSILRLASGTTALGVKQSEFRTVVVSHPIHVEEQAHIAERCRAVEIREASEVEQVNKLRQQKHGLMHDLLTGRVRVPVAAASEGGSA